MLARDRVVSVQCVLCSAVCVWLYRDGPGVIGLKIDDPAALQILSGKKMLEAKERVSLELPAGRHEFIVMIDRDVRKAAPVKIALEDVEGSSGRASLVGGL